MADSELPRLSLAGYGHRHGHPGRGEHPVRIERISGDLASLDKPVHVEGEVVEVREDGTVRIETPQGDIEIRLRGRETLQPGQPVEIDLPVGHPPRQAVIRPTSPPEQPHAPSPAEPRTVQRLQTPPTPDTRLPQPTPDIISPALLPQAQEQQATPTLPPVHLGSGDIVRLVVLPQNFSPATTEVVPPSAPAVFKEQSSPLLPSAFTIRQPTHLQPERSALLSSAQSPSENTPLSLTVPATPENGFSPSASSLRSFSSPLLALNVLKEFLLTGIQQKEASQIPHPAANQPSNPGDALQKTPQTTPGVLSGQTDSLKPGSLPAIEGRIILVAPPPIVSASAETSAKPQTDFPIAATAAPFKNIFLPRQETPTEAVTSSQILKLVVTGKTAGDSPIVALLQKEPHAEQHHFILQTGSIALPEGTVLDVMPLSAPGYASSPIHTAMIDPPALAAANLLPSANWPLMDEIIATLEQHGGQQIVREFIQIQPSPATPAKMTAAILFFVAAIRAGDAAGWLGERNMDILRRTGRTETVTRLLRDSVGISRLSSEPAAHDWRSMSLPMAWENDIRKAIIHYRHERNGRHEEGDEKPDARFIFDLSLPRIGSLQLDGLHRKGKLDLIVRTTTAFSPSMQQAMRRAYTNALEQTRLSGEISFQNRPEQWVNIIPAMAQAQIAALA